MPWTYWLIEWSVYLFAALLFWHAQGQGGRWVGTLLWGMAFGLAVEFALVSGVSPSYKYGDFLFMLGPGGKQVPLWVGMGWGEILYASTWTAQRLAQPWFLRPLTAAALAVNVDLSLDPVAHHQGFWTWNPEGALYGVPFDNFLGWFLIVAIYSGCVRGLFRLVPRNTWGNAAWVPFLAALMAVGIFLVAHRTLPSLYSGLGGQAGAFALVYLLSGAVAWGYVLRSRRDSPWSWQVLALPLYFHFVLLLMILVERVYDTASNGSLVVLVPLNLIVGAFAYAWVSLDRLLPAAKSP